MNKTEWQKYHGFTDDQMDKLCKALKDVNGTIVSFPEETWAVSYEKYINRRKDNVA